MPNYDNYRPEINYGEETLTAQSGVNNAESKPEEPRSRRVRNSRKRKPKVEEPRQVPKEKRKPFFKSISEWYHSPQARILWGIFMGCLTIYLAVSFIGYFTTCIQDQSKLGTPVGTSYDIANPGGEGGARLAELVINEGFGLGALVIIVWTGALALRALIGRPKFKPVDFTIKCIVALITVSLIIGLITYSVHTSVNWGGYHGTYVNEYIIHFIGSIGAVLLSIFMLALFIVICLRDLVNWLIRLKRKRDERRRIAAEEKAARLAKEEEIRRMQEQEEIDDLRAGETSLLSATDNMDAEPVDPLKFSPADASIYEYQEVPEDSEQDDGLQFRRSVSEPGDSFEQNAVAEPAEVSEQINSSEQQVKPEMTGSATTEASPDNENTDSVVSTDNPDESDENEGSDDLSGNGEHEDGSDADTMVVNVNTIGQSGNNRFKPDIEHFESHKYKFPPFDLLREGVERVSVDVEEQNANKRLIEQTLLDFGIPITRVEATVGPTVTLYEIVPDTGVKIAKIRSLSDDIALRLSATGVRIIAPIPGKGTVGIEVPNKDKQMVSMRTIIKSNKYQQSKLALPVALGSTISNDVYIADLAKMPHLLVAGATGQGKSVGLNAIIASLLYCKAPHEVKFVLIDPKQVEFSLYNKLKNYYLAAIPGGEDEPVITEMPKVEATLNSLCIEMEERYTLLKNAQTRNIEEYNAKIREGKLNPAEGHRFLPYIVVIVDEFGDLKMVLGNNIEMPIARLAQKARAVGMHVIIATQRPSTNVITGIIKANFPARISFKVTSGVDSKTILDTPGAQYLIGKGDLLIFNNSEMVRVQCAFIDTPEVASICEYVSHQPYPQGVYMLPEPTIDNGDSLGDATGGGPSGDRDPLFPDVARAVVQSGKASTSAVQRHYEIGYNRAGRIMDQLERFGVVGPAQGGKPRTVLMSPMDLEDLLSTLESQG